MLFWPQLRVRRARFVNKSDSCRSLYREERYELAVHQDFGETLLWQVNSLILLWFLLLTPNCSMSGTLLHPLPPNHATTPHLGSIHNLSRGWAMMIFFWKPPWSFQFFSSEPPSRDVDLSKENIIGPPHPSTWVQCVKLTLRDIKVLWQVYWALVKSN